MAQEFSTARSGPCSAWSTKTGPLKSYLSARYAAGLVAISTLLASGVALAADVPIFLGSIGVGKASPEVEAELRALFRAELASAAFSRVKTNQRYMLSATLVRLDGVQSAEFARATCLVSVAILRGGSTLFALVHGQATAEEDEVSAARSDALRAAVHSAMARIPQALTDAPTR